MGRGSKQLLKGLVSLGFLVYVLRQVGWGSLVAELRDAHVAYLVLHVMVSFTAIAVSAFKWRVLTRPRSLRASYPYLLGLYLVGMFFNQILPTSVGGDVVRAYELGRHESDGPAALASVFAERYTGLITLIAFAVVAIPLNPAFRELAGIWLLLAAAVGGLALGSWLVLDPRVRTAIQARTSRPRLERLMQKAERTQDAIAAYRHHRVAVGVAFLLSVTFYLTTVLVAWTGCMTFGARVPLATLATAVPLLFLLFLIPVSIGGIGLNEWAYTAVLALVGVPPAIGLSVGLLNRVRSVVFGLVGGALYPVLSVSGARPTAARPGAAVQAGDGAVDFESGGTGEAGGADDRTLARTARDPGEAG